MNAEPYRRKGFFHSVFPLFIFFLIQGVIGALFSAAQFMPIAQQMLAENPNIGYEELMEAMLSGFSEEYAMMLLLANICVIVYAGIMFLRGERKWNDLKYENKITLRDGLSMVAFGVGLYFLVNVFLTIVLSIFGGALGDSAELLNQTMEGVFSGGLLLSMLAVGVAAPLAEELIMRGLVYNRFSDITTRTTAMLISAFLFGMMHMPIFVQALYAFALGVVFAYAYGKFENILIPIILHVAYNMTSFLFTIPSVSAFFETMAGSIVFYALAVALSFFGFRYLRSHAHPALKPEFRKAVSDGNEE